MGFLDRLFGTEPQQVPPHRPRSPQAAPTDEQALQRYRYMLETAPPETIEQAHEEAFAKLTPDQRRQVLSGLAEAAPAGERDAITRTPVNDTRALARTATRAEIRQPGVMERTLSGGGMGLSGGGLSGGGFAGSMLSSFAMGFVGSMVANSFFSAMGGFGGEGDAGGDADAGGETADNSATDDAATDAGWDGDGGDFGGGDFDV